MQPKSELESIEPTADVITLTPNQALADSLLKRDLETRESTGVATSRVQSLPRWLENHLLSPLDRPLASDLQLTALWQEVIQSLDLPFDLHPPTLAPIALSGWRNLHLWRVDKSMLQQCEYGQDIQFSHWCQLFEQRLERLDLTTLELLAEEALQATPSSSHTSCVLTGFVEPPPPLWRALIEQSATRLDWRDWPDEPGTSYQCGHATPAEELAAVAQWAANHAENPAEGRIGIVVTQGEARIRQLEDELGQHGLATQRRRPLGQMGVIQGALTLLHLNAPRLGIGTARALVQCPYWGQYPSDQSLRATWESRLCNLEIRELTRSDLNYCFQESPEILAVTAALPRREHEQSPGDWAQLFQQQLEQLGWPGLCKLTEEQALAYEAWPELLGDLASLATIVPQMTWPEALHWLRRAADNRRLPRTRLRAVAILDRIEEAVDFDTLWMLGADDRNWPPPPAPHPLIPFRIQHQFDMPRSSANHELATCRRLLDSLQCRGSRILFSFAQLQDDIRCSLTPLLDDLSPAPLATHQDTLAPAIPFEWVDCSQAPALPPQTSPIKGGHELLRVMAASPFDAYALYRLDAVPLGQPVDGINPRDRGKLIHDLLERIWRRLEGSQERLVTMGEQRRAQLISELVQESFRHWKGGWRYGSKQIQLMQSRLHRSVADWLNLEVERPPFRVQATEQELELPLGPIQLRLRIDRIDQTDEGLMLIDYKSGSSGKIDDWRTSPPGQPQLPLYCIALEDTCAAIAFARVKESECQLVTLGPGSRLSESEWLDLQTQWRTDLTELANQFAAGFSPVYEKSTGYFDRDPLEPLHRFAEFEDLQQWRQSE